MPDVDGYRDATRGRALSIKCRGGQTAPVAVPSTGWEFRYDAAAISTASGSPPKAPAAGTIYALEGSRVSGPIVSLARLLSPPMVRRILVSTTQHGGGALPEVPFAANDQYDLRAYDTANMVVGFLRFAIVEVAGRTNVWEIIPNQRLPDPVFGSGRNAANDSVLRITAPSDAPTDPAGTVMSPGFEFWGRIDEGAGTVLEDNGLEVATIDMTCRYDSRHTVGDYVTIGNEASYNFVITELDYIGREKWQVLTMKRLRVPDNA